jgi:predicted nucleotidyltransferase
MQTFIRERISRLDRLLDGRASEKLLLVTPQVDLALWQLRKAGVQGDVVGSMARGEFRSHSDVDFLVSEKGSLSEVEVFNLIAENVKAIPFDIVFAEQLSMQSQKLMRDDSQPR